MSVRVKKLKILIGAANKIKKLYFASPLVSSPRSFGMMRTFLSGKSIGRAAAERFSSRSPRTTRVTLASGAISERPNIRKNYGCFF